MKLRTEQKNIVENGTKIDVLFVFASTKKDLLTLKMFWAAYKFNTREK